MPGTSDDPQLSTGQKLNLRGAALWIVTASLCNLLAIFVYGRRYWMVEYAGSSIKTYYGINGWTQEDGDGTKVHGDYGFYKASLKSEIYESCEQSSLFGGVLWMLAFGFSLFALPGLFGRAFDENRDMYAGQAIVGTTVAALSMLLGIYLFHFSCIDTINELAERDGDTAYMQGGFFWAALTAFAYFYCFLVSRWVPPTVFPVRVGVVTGIVTNSAGEVVGMRSLVIIDDVDDTAGGSTFGGRTSRRSSTSSSSPGSPAGSAPDSPLAVVPSLPPKKKLEPEPEPERIKM